MDCRQESCEAEGCGWKSRCGHPDPDGLGHSLPMWLQDTTVRNTCSIHFYPGFLPQPASPPFWSVDLPPPMSMSMLDRITPHWTAAGLDHHLARTTHTTSLASTAWLDMDAETHCLGPRGPKRPQGPKDLPRSEHLWNDRPPPAGSCVGNMGKFSKMDLLCPVQQK